MAGDNAINDKYARLSMMYFDAMSQSAPKYMRILQIRPVTKRRLKDNLKTFWAPLKSFLASFSAVTMEIAMGIPALETCNNNN